MLIAINKISEKSHEFITLKPTGLYETKYKNITFRVMLKTNKYKQRI